MSKFFNNDLADLAHQLTLSPRRLRVGQLRGIERLLSTVEAERAYPYDFVCFHVTKYRRRGTDTGASIPGTALVADLVTMADVISRKTKLTIPELGEPVSSQQELAAELSISTKTARRWRSRGLMGLRVVCDDGVNRLVFTRSTIDRFKAQNKNLVTKGAAFKQLTSAERDRIIERARELVTAKPLKLHAVARLIAEETGRAVETVRYTLRRFDAASDAEPLFASNTGPRHDERALAMWTCCKNGESVASIAHAMDCDTSEVEQCLRTVQVQQWQHEPLECIPHELFDAPNADAIILDAPEPVASDRPVPKIPKDLPPYLQSLYRTPLLEREQEVDLFRRYNYLKHKTTKLVAALTASDVGKQAFDEVRALMDRVELTRQRIVRANLRLVVSIAKRHVGYSSNFFEVVSDGNMSLLRAAEKFDFARGFRFSTYATWAISKNYARSIPEQRRRAARLVTGQELALETVPDTSEALPLQSDRAHVQSAIDAGLNELTEREREVLRGHFGLGAASEPATLEQLGKRFGVTKERVRQIEQKALARLRDLLAPSLADAF